MARFDLEVRTHGGVEDLGRVVGVLTLLDLTPTALRMEARSPGLLIHIDLESEERLCARAVSRLGVMPAIVEASFVPSI